MGHVDHSSPGRSRIQVRTGVEEGGRGESGSRVRSGSSRRVLTSSVELPRGTDG